MNLVELHPEDLLDKEASGSLSPEERLRLDAHLDRCVACAFERSVRVDLRSELGDQDESPRFQMLISGALKAGMDAPDILAPRPLPTEPARAPGGEPARPALPWTRRPALLLAAALVLASGAAAARTEVASHLWSFSKNEIATALGLTPPTAAPVAVLAAVPAAGPAGPHAPAARPDASPAAADEPAPVASSAPSAPSAPFAPFAPSARRLPAVALPTGAPRGEVRPDGVPAAVPAASSEPPETAASLFERASVARRQGRRAEAMGLYQQLQGRFGASSEARLAVALLARMHLDQGSAAAALAGYDAYLRSGNGALREEAMAGRALALGRLGQGASEAQAWSALLAAFPRTSYAALAAKRLDRAAP